MFGLSKKPSRPSIFLAVTEAGRALTELGISYSYQSLNKEHQTAVDGHPVMILPGFMSTKASTKMLREHVAKLGYPVYDWGMGRNYGKMEYMAMLVERLEKIKAKHGAKVSVIGWSLGGVFAREIAKARPDLIRQVVTLGAPFQDITHPNNVSWIYTLISGGKKVEDTDWALLENMPNPAPVPTTAIYTKEDGIVPWQVCMEMQEDALHQNVQVRGSHFGLGVNSSVFWIISDRLKYEKDNWQHFKPESRVKELLFYPSF
jgi:alpha/beta superfamily hydrolase